MNKKLLIKSTITFVKDELKNAEGGHDWFHIERVYNTSKRIGKRENANMLVIELGALLHDIADSKFYNGNESLGPKKARDFLEIQQVDESTILHVENIIKNISYKSGLTSNRKDNSQPKFTSKELEVIQDADRLDAIGAIGIARAFNYGGFRNRPLYDPEIKPIINQTKEEYKKSTAPTINHFYEKLLLLKDKMNTETGKKMAKKRHQFVEEFLTRFYNECEGKL